MIRVVITAAYASLRAGLQSLLTGVPNVDVVSVVACSRELLQLVAAAQPDVIVADDDPNDRTALIAAAADSEAALVMLTGDRRIGRDLATSTVLGYAVLLREAEGAEIVAGVLSAAAGLVTFDRSLLLEANVPAVISSFPIAEALPDPMTVRELEVLQLLAQGLPNKVIANRLQISQHTVKFHVASILSKLNAGSRTEAVTLGARRGLVTI